MAENSNIDWCDDTLNVWLGCLEVRLVVAGQPVDSECDNCYAKWLVLNRMGYNGKPGFPVLWGNPKTTPRVQTKYWRRALWKWQNQALTDNARRLVFAFSLSDVFEEHPMVGEWRQEFLQIASGCVMLDFLLLTKRPQNIERMVPQAWARNWPQHVWIGTSTGTQAALNRRLPYMERMTELGAPVRFLSVEPMLEPMDLTAALKTGTVNWVITGGESGSDTGIDRPRIDADPDWFRRVRDLCLEYDVAFFHKQSGGRRPGTGKELDGRLWHQWPDTGLGPVGGVRSAPSAELVGTVRV